MLKIIQSKEQYTNDVYFVFSVQEEIGMRGSRVAITTLEPDIIIDLDVSPVGKLNSLEMGAGVGIKISDSIVVSDQDLVEQCERLARENDVIYQREVSDCGTTELIITNEKDNGAKHIGLLYTMTEYAYFQNDCKQEGRRDGNDAFETIIRECMMLRHRIMLIVIMYNYTI